MKCVTKAKNVMNAKDKSCRLKVRTPPGHKGYPGDTPRLWIVILEVSGNENHILGENNSYEKILRQINSTSMSLR